MFWVESMEINQLTFVLTLEVKEALWEKPQSDSIMLKNQRHDTISNALRHPNAFFFRINVEINTG